MSWNDLSMKDRASYIKLGIENGITDLDAIRGIYNKFALGGDTKDSSKYIYADSDTTDPNFTDLTPIGEGVYKNKFGKIVYDTTKVTPPKKDKSINDNWQTAYAKGVPSGTMSADMETMNAVTGGAFNLISPSQWAGAFGRGAYNNEWEKIPYYLLAGNNGIVTDNFAQEHPWYSMGANLLFDTATLGAAIAGKSGSYKTPNHATYPDLGANSWLNNDKIFNMSARQAVPENTDRVLDYLGSDLDYNRGATKVMYDGAYQLPEITVTPNGNHTELIPNELGTGWMYRDRAGRFANFNYDYVNRYDGNQKALGGNLFADGGKKATRYRSSSNIRKQISTWEGSTMRTNVPFDEMDTRFNQVLPEGALEKLSQEQLDGLYSFAYNVGTGRFKTRTAPTLAKYLQGNATIEDVKGTMWASGDKKYRGLANRRKKERSMLGAYVPVQETIPMTTPLATPLDITPAVQPIIESNPVIQDNIETLPLAFNTESQKESYYTPGFFDYVNYINQIRQPKQPKQRDRRIWLTI